MLFLSSLSFFALGVALVLFGTNQAELARDLALDLEQSGFLGASLALGLGGGVMIGGPLYDRLPRKQLFVVSAALTGVALLAAAPDASYGRIVCVVLLAGICSIRSAKAGLRRFSDSVTCPSASRSSACSARFLPLTAARSRGPRRASAGARAASPLWAAWRSRTWAWRTA